MLRFPEVGLSQSKVGVLRAPAWLALSLFAVGCGGDSASDSDTQAAVAAAGGLRTIAAAPAEVKAVAWGRGVDVYDLDPATGESELRMEGVVIGPDVATDDVDYTLRRDAVAGRDELVVLHPRGSAEYAEALRRAERALVPITASSVLDPRLDHARPVARDAVLVLGFDEALNPRTVNSDNVHLAVGVDALPVPVSGLRILGDPHHGRTLDIDGDGVSEWAPARILVHLAVDELDALEHAVPIQPSAGLPAGVVATISLGRASPPSSGGPAQFELPPVAAAFRTVAGPEGLLAGFGPPLVIGDQFVFITQIVQQAGGLYDFSMTFDNPNCALAAEGRDLLILPGAVLQIVGGLPPTGGTSSGVARLRSGDPAGVGTGPAVHRSPWLLAQGDPPECFVQTVPPVHATNGIQPDSIFRVRFSEPMDPASLRAMESVAVRRAGAASPIEEPVVGEVVVAADLRGLSFVPALPLEHAAGGSETYFFDLLGKTSGVRDATGINLQQDLPGVRFHIDANAASVDTGGVVLRFASLDPVP